jgi:hypothetical protein
MMIFYLTLIFLATIVVLGWVTTRRDVTPILAVTLVFYFFNWLFTPIVLTIWGWERVLPRGAINDLDVFERYSVLEAFAFLATVVVFALMRHRFGFITNSRAAQWRLPRRIETAAIVLAMAGGAIARSLLIATVGKTYSEGNNFALRADLGTMASVNILLLVESFSSAFLIVALIERRKRPRYMTLAMWAYIILGALQWTLFGQRMALLTPCIVLLYYIHERAPSRALLAASYAAVGAFIGTVGIVGALVIGQLRGGDKLELTSAASQSKDIVSDRSRGGPLWAAFDQIQIKFDGVSMGAFLVEEFGSGTGGFRPYVGSLLALIPRFILLDKPIPGSADGTFRGTPPRLVAVSVGYDPETANVGVSPASVEVWHFGFLGLLPLVLLNALHWRLVNSLLSTPSFVLRSLALYLIGIPALVGIYNSGDVLIMMDERALALFFLLAVLPYFVFRPRRKAVAASAPPAAPAVSST